MATEKAIARPNFFILLELDPNAPWDQVAFENVLRAKRNEWSRQGAWSSQKALIAKQNLALIPEMQKVMGDAELRKKEADDAREQKDVKRQERREAFEKQLAYINRGGAINEEDLEKFIDAFKDILSPADIRRRIIVPVQDEPLKAIAAPQLDPTKAKRIAELLNLDVVKRKTLYHLLELPSVTGTVQLHEAAEHLYHVATDRVPKTAEVTAIAELAGLAMEVFKSEEMRQRYNESLRQAGLDGLLRHVDELMARTVNRRMEPEQVTLFLEEAQSAGWEREEALQKLEEHGFQRKWTVRPPGAGSLTPKVQCGKCGQLNNQDDKNCVNCGSELYLDCPNCGQRIASSQQACGHCGFLIGNRFLVDTLLEELPPKLKVGDLKQYRTFSESVRNLEEVKNLLGTLEKAWRPKQPDLRLRKIQEAKKQADALEAAQQEERRKVTVKLDQLIAQRRLYEAQSFIVKNGEFLPEQEKVEKKRIIDEGIAQAQSLMKEAYSQSLGPDQKVSRVRKVLQLCADFQDAVDMLKMLPIAPPRNLQAWVSGSMVSLTWEASTTPDVDYTIVRKVGVRPGSAKDGELLKSVSGLSYEDKDTSSVIGRPLYYAIYAGFDTAASDQASVLAQPVLLTQDVSAVKVTVGTQCVDLSWETPPNVDSVVIVRKLHAAPTSIHDGQRVAQRNAQEKQFTDRQVQNGQTYYYGLYAQFKNHEGRLVSSGGKIMTAIPEEPPQPVSSLDINATRNERGEFEVSINWSHGGKGDVVVVKTDKSLSHLAGKIVPEGELYNQGNVLQAGPNGAATVDIWDKSGAAFYTPAVTHQGMAYVGNSQRFVCRDNITNVQWQNTGNAIRLTWKWPDNCQEVLLSYKTNEYPHHPGSPTDLDPTATTRKVYRVQYEGTWGGHCDLQGGEQQYYILLTAILEDGGQRSVPEKSIEVLATQQARLVLTYRIEKERFGRGKKLVIGLSDPSQTTPRLRLIYKQGYPSMMKTSGAQLLIIDPINTLGKKEWPVPLPPANYAPDTYATLLLDDDDWRDRVTIRHPDKEKMRLA